jgi:hypothetical protein
MRMLEQLLFWIHGLSGAAWFGAIFYRTFIVDSKAFAYFPERADYERFTTHMAHGMRWLVIAGLVVCGSSGFALAIVRWNGSSEWWLALMLAKVLVWVAAGALFTYVSWVHWPWRSLAAPEEMMKYRFEGQMLAAGMVLLTGAGFALGQAGKLLAG